MINVVPLVERKSAFDPEEITVLVAAFEKAWTNLRACGSECTRPAYARAMREVVAKRIFDVARRGVGDADQIAREAASFLAANYRHEPERRAS